MTDRFVILIMALSFFAEVSFAETKSSAYEDKLIELEQKINQSLEESAFLQSEKNQLAKKTVDLQNKIRERRKEILKRLKAQARIKNYKLGEFFLNSNLNELNRNIKILKNLNAHDLIMFNEYRSALFLLTEARRNLEETEKQIKLNVSALERQQTELKTLEEIAVKFLNTNQQSSFLLSKGALSRPLDGTLKQEFGNIQDEQNRYFLLNQGEVYLTERSKPVRSVGPGVVIFRDLLGERRETLIVQHSGNYYTVYAGLDKIKKKVGDSVTQNEIVAHTSDNEFYFEMRHYGSPINPKKWYGDLK